MRADAAQSALPFDASADDVGAEARFLSFHRANPVVYDTLKRLALEAVRRGRARIGIGMLWEVMRWNIWIETDDADGWKLNNNFRSRYARLLMASEPELAGAFETRELRT